MFGRPAQKVNGVDVSAKAYDILKALSAQIAPTKVQPLAEVLKGLYSDITLYRILEELNTKKLVILDPRIEHIKGFDIKQKYWSATDDVKAFFARERLAQST